MHTHYIVHQLNASIDIDADPSTGNPRQLRHHQTNLPNIRPVQNQSLNGVAIAVLPLPPPPPFRTEIKVYGKHQNESESRTCPNTTHQ